MKSIIQKNKKCWCCGTTYGLESHHVFFGSANRKQSEKYGLKVWLCREHHHEVHHNHALDINIKTYCQRTFEETHSREEFRQIFGKSWL